MSSVALVTGASAGLGLEYAKLFAADGHDVVLVARRRDRLEALAAELREKHRVQAHVIDVDLAEAGAPERVVAEVQRLGLAVEYLVNNAGFGTSGAFADLDAGREIAMVQVNVTALVALTRAFLPGMVERGRGRILNIGSTAGFQPGPFMATYYASKAFVNSFTEALWYELKGTGVTATVSCPGATATEFAGLAGNDASRLFRMGAASAEEVARQGYRAMLAGKPMLVHGAKNKIAAFSVRFSPRGILRAVAASLNRSPQGKGA
jgi:short-subunit dehydrogenase